MGNQNDNKQDPINEHETSQSKKTFQLDEVFQPSATMSETDWFILDENGRRRRKMSKDEIDEVKHIIEESNHVKETSSKNQNEDNVSTSTENIETHSTNSVTSTIEFISTERSTEPSTNLDSS